MAVFATSNTANDVRNSLEITGIFSNKKDKLDLSLSFLFVGDIDLSSNQMLDFLENFIDEIS